METPSHRTWFLRKHDDGRVFGPLSFGELTIWASTGQIAPYDSLSIDQQSWIKAPMLPQLGMDWLVEMTSEHYYGPTTLAAIQQFFRRGEINEKAFLINTCDGSQRRLQEMPAFLEIPKFATTEDSHDTQTRARASETSTGLQERIHDLEQTLSEERRTYAELEQKYNELVQRVGT